MIEYTQEEKEDLLTVFEVVTTLWGMVNLFVKWENNFAVLSYKSYDELVDMLFGKNNSGGYLSRKVKQPDKQRQRAPVH
jgi:hypothetical protein